MYPCPYNYYNHCWQDKQAGEVLQKPILHRSSSHDSPGSMQKNKPALKKMKNENGVIVMWIEELYSLLNVRRIFKFEIT